MDMATDPFADVGFKQEVSQSTYVELITATRRTGKAIRTICDETSGELICDEGLSPAIRVRDLAFRKQVTAKPTSKGRFVADPGLVPDNTSGQKVEYKLDSDSAVRAQSYKAQRSESEFRKLVKNHNAEILQPQFVQCPGNSTILNEANWATSNGGSPFDSQGWNFVGQLEVFTEFRRITSFNNGISAGSATDKIYSTAEDSIRASDVNGDNLVELRATGGHATDISLDRLNGHIYWCENTDTGVRNTGTRNGIFRCDLDGSQEQTILSLSSKPFGLEVDATNGHIYYSLDSGEIRRVNTDGSGDTLIVTATYPPKKFFVDNDENKLYYTAHNVSGDGGFYEVPLAGGLENKILDHTDNFLLEFSQAIVLNKERGYREFWVSTIKEDSSTRNTILIISENGGVFDGFTIQPLSQIYGLINTPDLYLDEFRGEIYTASLEERGNIIRFDAGSRGGAILYSFGLDVFTGVTRGGGNYSYMTDIWGGLEPGQLVNFSIDILEISQGTPFAQSIDASGNVIEEVPLVTGVTNTTFAAGEDSTLQVRVAMIADLDREGYVDVQSVAVCALDDSFGEKLTCADGEIVVNNSDFDENRGGWNGGILNTEESAITNVELPRTTSPGISLLLITQTFTGLQAGSNVTVKMKLGDVTPYDTNDPGSDAGVLVDLVVRDSFGLVAGYDALLDARTNGIIIIENVTVPEDGILLVEARMPTGQVYNTGFETIIFGRYIEIDQLIVCENDSPVDDTCEIIDVRAELQWRGIPRQPVNIFRSFIQYKLRDPDDPTKSALINWVPIVTNHITGCDFWDQQGNGGETEGTPTRPPNVDVLFDVSDGDLLALPANENFVWSIPFSTDATSQNPLTIRWPSPQIPGSLRRSQGDDGCSLTVDEDGYKPCIVESVTFFFLSNRIDPAESATGEFQCTPDPASELDVTLNYRRNDGTLKTFTQTINKNEFYQQEDDISGWKNIGATGNGVPGEVARWGSFTFELDSLDGSGIDQCSVGGGISYQATGEGALEFRRLGLKSDAFTFEPCIPTVAVTTVIDGGSQNEIQSVVLPNPGGGTYTLNVTIAGSSEDTDPIDFDASASELASALAALDLIASTDNISVTGSGTELDPFLVEFVGGLAAEDIDLMTGDASNLVGSATAIFRTVRHGTLDERQRLNRLSDTLQPCTLSFNGAEGVELTYHASLNNIQATLESLPTIGPGNINVTGLTTNRDAPYTNTVFFEFVGEFAAQNVAQISVDSPESSAYSVTTDWNGGIGVNELQELTINASSGTFTITVTDPIEGVAATTGDIAYDASATAMKDAIVAAADWITDTDIEVLKPADNRWTIEFIGDLAKQDVPQSSVDPANLTGGSIVITTIQNGGGTAERQRVSLLSTTGGSFKLRVTDPNLGGVETTASIQYNASAEDLEAALADLSFWSEEDIGVEGNSPEWLVAFRKALGNVPVMVPITDGLICDPAAVRPVPEPPYEYELPKPGPGDPLPEESPLGPIPDSANVYVQTVLQRYLFDPNLQVNGQRQTLRQLALKRGLNPNDYAPYLRTCDNSRLVESSYSTEISTQESYVLIAKEIDSSPEQQRILKHLGSSRSILPTRFSWDCLEI